MRRNPESTAARLLADVELWHELFTPGERDAVALVRSRLHDIADIADRERRALRDDLCPDCRTSTLENLAGRRKRCTECGCEYPSAFARSVALD